MADIGGDPEHQHEAYIRRMNEALTGRPEDMRVTTHMCRGNFRSSWAAEGSYEFVAEVLPVNYRMLGVFRRQAQTRQEFLAALDLSGPGLSSVRSAN